MRVEYDPEADALYIRLRSGRYAESEEVNENTLLDLDARGRILAVEVLNVSKALGRGVLERTLQAEGAAA